MSIGVLVVVVLSAVLAPYLAEYVVGHGPNESFLTQTTDEFGLPTGPSSRFWFGVDPLGRDLFVRVLYGARTSLAVASLATVLSMGLGVLVGVVAGYFGGVVDSMLSRLTDVALALPAIMLILGLVTACSTPQGCAAGLIRPGTAMIVIILGIFAWPIIARVIRAATLSLREREYVAAATVQGFSAMKIIREEILPNLAVQVVVLTALQLPAMIIAEATLSYLGAGVPPETPSWGRMLQEGGNLITVAWWMVVFPGIFLFLTTVSFNILGDELQQALDPRSPG